MGTSLDETNQNKIPPRDLLMGICLTDSVLGQMMTLIVTTGGNDTSQAAAYYQNADKLYRLINALEDLDYIDVSTDRGNFVSQCRYNYASANFRE